MLLAKGGGVDGGMILPLHLVVSAMTHIMSVNGYLKLVCITASKTVKGQGAIVRQRCNF